MIINKGTVKHNKIYDKTMELGTIEHVEYKFYLKLKYYRKLLNLSQIEFSKFSGIDHKNLTRYESNKITPSSGLLKQMTDGINKASLLLTDGKAYLDLTMSDMLNLTEEDPNISFEVTKSVDDVKIDAVESAYELHSNVGNFRKALGLSQAKLATYLGIKRPTLSYYESLEKYIPSPEKLQLLIDAFRNLSDMMSNGEAILNLNFDDLLKFELINN